MANVRLPRKHESLLREIGRTAEGLGVEVYLVGGYVRDWLLARGIDPALDGEDVAEGIDAPPPGKDLDFVTVGSGVELARKVAAALGARHVAVFKKFGTAHMNVGDLDLEFVGARRESYDRNSRKPVVEDGTLRDDQLRRDLTINALSVALNPGRFGALLDPFDGLADLRNRLVRTPVDPHQTFDDDPLRMLRAIRFAVRLHFDIEEATYRAIGEMRERIRIVSKERVIDEINGMVMADRPSAAFWMMEETGLLKEVFPEICRLKGVKDVQGKRHKDNFAHTLQVLDNVADVSDDLWLRWAAILHDIAKPATQRFVNGVGWTFHGHEALGAKWVPGIFRRLGLPLDDRMRFVQTLVRLHLRPIALVSDVVTDSAVRRLLFEAGEQVDALMTLCRADITSKNEARVQQYLENFELVERKLLEVEEKDRIRNWKNPVTGEQIMETLGIPPGPQIGLLKEAVKEAVLEGKIPNEPEAAHAWMVDEARRLGIGGERPGNETEDA